MSHEGRGGPNTRSERDFKAKAERIDRLAAATELTLRAITETTCAGDCAVGPRQHLLQAAFDLVKLACELATSEEALRERYENDLAVLVARVAGSR